MGWGWYVLIGIAAGWVGSIIWHVAYRRGVQDGMQKKLYTTYDDFLGEKKNRL